MGRKTILDVIEADLGDDMFTTLEARVGGMTVKKVLTQIYEDNQEMSYREKVHASDLLKPDAYRGQPQYCRRKIILSAHFNGQPVKHPQIVAARFERGTDMHKRWQEKMRRGGYTVDIGGFQGIETNHEVSWSVDGREPSESDWRLLFTPDLFVDLRIGRGTEILELKGYNQKTYLDLVKDKNPPADAYLQASVYMWLSGVHKATIIVENKNTQDFTPWQVDFDPEVVKPFENRVGEIDILDLIYRTEGHLPNGICASAQSPAAKECSLVGVCFAGKVDRERQRVR